MDNALDAFLFKEPVQGRPVPDIQLVEAGGRVDGGRAQVTIPALSWNVLRFRAE